MILGGTDKLDQPIWLDTAQAGDRAQKHRDTIEKACQAEELHGVQRKKRAHWRIHRDCLDTWVAGDLCVHQRRAQIGIAS